MAAVGFARAGDGQATAQATFSLTIPAGASVGDKAVLAINADGAPAFTAGGDPAGNGWTPVGIIGGGAFPVTGSGGSSAWVFEKTIAAGDPGATFSWTFTTSIRGGALLGVFSGRGTPTVAVATDPAAVTTYTLPTATSAAGSDVFAAWARRRSGATGTITVPAPYTQPTTVGNYENAFASGVNTFGADGYRTNVAAGTVGGESGSTAVSSIGYNLLVLLPAGNVSINVAAAAAGPASAAVAPQVAPAVPAALAGSAAGAPFGVTVSSGVDAAIAGPAASGTVEPGTAAPVDPAAAGPAAGAPLGVSVAAGAAPVFAGPTTGGPVGGSAAIPIAPAVAGPATGGPAEPTEIYRYQWWDGTQWQRMVPLVWDGAGWVEVPVTLTEPFPRL